jgi:hypothetical protein
MRIMDTIFLIVRFFFNLISSNVKAKWPFLTCTGCHIVSSVLSTYNRKGVLNIHGTSASPYKDFLKHTY